MSEPTKLPEGLSPRQRKLLELMMKEKADGSATRPKERIPVRRPADPPLLSFAQQRLWFIEQFQPGTAAYNIPSGVRLRGPLETALFAESLARTASRHDTMRSTFGLVDGRPLQVVAESVDARLPVIDLRALPEELREAEAKRAVNRLARLSFDLAAAPPWRALLVRLGDEDHVFLTVMHHIISDTWTTGVFFREMVGHYKSLSEHLPAKLPELPVQYADYSVWQRRSLEEGGELTAQLEYWKRKLAGAPQLLELPTDRPRPLVPSFRGGRISLLLPNSLTDRLKAVSAEHDSTLFMMFMASYQTLLHRYTGQDDVLVGTPMANRTRVELENLIGVFVNTLVLRTSFAGDPAFRRLFDQVRETSLEGLSNHDVPFEKVIEELNLERDTSRNPLFQVLFAFQNVPIPKLIAEGLSLERYEFQETTARLDVELDLQEMPYGFVGWVGYNSDLFEHATAARIASNLRNLLEGIAENPDLPVRDLPLMSAEEQAQVVEGWNATEVPCDTDRCLHELFEARADAAPDAVAVEAADATLTYAELEDRANRLADLLISLGVSAGTMVAVHLERGAGSVVALLAILKAGGSYVPLATSFPPARMEAIVRMAGVRHLVTEASRAAAIEGLAPLLEHVALLDEPAADARRLEGARLWTWADAQARSATRPRGRTFPDALAYTIFTSGSTGTPKGVMVRHRPAINLIDWVNRTFQVGPGDRQLFITSLSFDLSVYDVFGILAAGGTVRVASDEEARDPQALVRILAEEPITFWDSAPAALQQLASFFPAEPAVGSHLRLVFLSGDWIPVTLPDQVRAAFPKARVISLGGATEATVWSNSYPIGEVEPWWPSIPYGRPIQNAAYYVLDGKLRPLPIGVPGDLYIGGGCLSAGYLGSPDVTAEKYVPDPFGAAAGSRLYRTGDRARFWADGNLEFLGRLDQQVKVRGYRIELGEIEAALAQLPAVREAAVLARQDTPGDKRLVAYVVPAPDASPSLTDLREGLRQRLPEYMVPSAFLFLDALPVTANGKLDRQALPAPEGDRPSLESVYVDPQDETERRIAELWKQVLRVDRVGRNDNFFELGGHSMLLTQIHKDLQESIAPDLTLVDLFTYPTVGSLAEYLSRSRGAQSAILESMQRAAARRESGDEREDIAVIGIALRFPGAEDVETFWDNLRNGVESVRFFTRDEVLQAGVSPEQVDHPDYVRAEGDIHNVDMFDYGFFGYANPADVEMIDPQQRIFMECAWEALERAGYDPATCGRSIGVFGGVNISSYLFSNLYDHDPLSVMSHFLTRIGLLVGNQNDYACTRIAYHFNLQGPAVTVQTACSTATVGVHMACQSLQRHECDMCLAGGAQIRVPQGMGYMYQEGGFPSPDGHCRSFDAKAKGNVHGNGAGVLLLKRLSDALRDGDHVHAVLKGSAACNDGSVKVGFTAPGVDGQAKAAAQAMAVAGVHPDTIGYLEATGTATELGDPIEIEALTRAYRLSTDRKGYVPLGSVKSNIGHLDAASGAAALIKTILSLEREAVPPSLHFEAPNPRIDFANSPFFVNAELRPWPRAEEPRRAAVHTYAVGGTNTHLILEEAPLREASSPSRPWQLLLLSARSSSALHAATANLARRFSRHSEAPLADAAFTLQTGRRHFPVRRAVLCRDVQEALECLETLPGDRVATQPRSGDGGALAWLFPDAGSFVTGTGAALYRTEPAFREQVDRCAEVLRGRLGADLAELIAGTGPARPLEPSLAQPALFAFELALARLWQEWGIAPRAVLGEGVGEVVAACVAGVLSLEHGVTLAAARGRALEAFPAEARLEVAAAEDELRPYLGAGLSLEAVLGSSLCRVAGPEEAALDLQDRLNEEGIDCFYLGTRPARPAADHPVAQAFAAEVGRLSFAAPSLPLVSGAAGTLADAGALAKPDHWVRQLAAPFRFAAAVRELLQDPRRIFLEVGPGGALSAAAARLAGEEGGLSIASLGDGEDGLPEEARLLKTLGNLWLAGVAPDWTGFYRHERRNRVPLPTYPFERTRIWAQPTIDRQVALLRQPSLHERRALDDWFWAPSWKRSEQPHRVTRPDAERPWLVLADPSGVGERLARRLREEGGDVVLARPGEGFGCEGGEYRLRPGRRSDWMTLLAALRDEGRLPGRVVHLWPLVPQDEDSVLLLREEPQDLCFWSLLHLTRSLAELGCHEGVRIDVVTSGAQEVTGEETLFPDKATALSLCKVIPQEMPGLACRAIDVVAPEGDGPRATRLVEALLAEVLGDGLDPVVAWRGARRWVQTWEPLQLEEPVARPGLLRDEGVYLVAGSVQGFGLLVAGHLARTARARLVLAGSTGLPDPEVWDEWLATHRETEETAARIREIRGLEALGAQVLLCEADLTSREQVRRVVDQAVAKFGGVDGVIWAAGEQGPEFARGLAQVDHDFFEYRLRSRLSGLVALEEALRGREPGFWMLAATVASALGGPAVAVDCAADMFLDLYARRRAQDGGASWVSVDWDAFDAGQGGAAVAGSRTGITAEEGVRVFDRVLAASGLPQVVVSTVDLQARVDHWIGRRGAMAPEDRSDLQERPQMPTPFVDPRNDMERQVARIWGEVLRIRGVGAEDNFFDLGGNSLVATQLVSRLRGAFQVDLALQDFFEGATVANVAENIQVTRWAREAQQEEAGVLAGAGSEDEEEMGRI
jgi:amino acid adenylation domain-containing protein